MSSMTRKEIEDARDHLKAWFPNQSVERHTFNKICDQAVLALKQPEAIRRDAERWRQHAEIVRMGGVEGALTMRLTMRENGKVWETQYVLDTAEFGREAVLGLRAIGMAAEQKAQELFSAMSSPSAAVEGATKDSSGN